MSVSDESANGTDSIRPKRRLVRLSQAQWLTARHQYESGEFKSYPQVAKAYGVSEETVSKHARANGWMKGAKIAESAQTQLRHATESALTKVGEQIAVRIGSKMEKDMSAWFEREKGLHTRDTHRRAKARQKLVDSIVDEQDGITPKDMAFIAKADDTYDNMKRRNLGMSDGNGPAGSLSMRILAGNAAIQINGQAA